MRQDTVAEEVEIEIEVAPPVSEPPPRRRGSRSVAATATTAARAVVWTKVTTPRAWHPTKPGAELIDYYAGRSTCDGAFGQYDVVLVAVPGVGMMTVSGVKPLSAVEASGVQLRTPVKFVFNGLKDIGRENKLKDIDVYVDAAFLEPITELPKITSASPEGGTAPGAA